MSIPNVTFVPMNATELAEIMKAKGHGNAYAKINFLLKDAVGMMPKDSEKFFDDLMDAIKETSKEEVAKIAALKKLYLKTQRQ